MALLGYSQDVTAGYQLAVECDAEIAAHELCPSCERHGLDYLAFFRGCSYRGVRHSLPRLRVRRRVLSR
jgi:hypothetical protein